MTTYQIWCEGYAATGGSSGAIKLGVAEGSSLKEACTQLAKQDSDFARYFDAGNLSYWGCKIFDNASDAQQRYG
jgi:hypothetical protein